MDYPAAALILLAVLWFAALSYLRRRRSSPTPPLPPGPAGLPIVGSLLSLDPDLHTHFATLARSYGPIFSIRLGTKLGVVVSSPPLAKAVLRDHDAALANHDVPAVARALTYGGCDIVWAPMGPTWRMLRRICVREVLSPSRIDAVYSLRRRELRATISYIHARAGSPVDVGAQMFLTILNVSTSMLWGGTVEKEEERARVGGEFRELVGAATELLGKPNLSDFFPAVARLDLQGLERQMTKLKVHLDQIFEAIIQQRTEKTADGGEDEDFLGFMMKLVKEGEGGGVGKSEAFTWDNVKALFMDFVIGGTDTTSNTLEWAMAEMMKKPETMKRAQQELDEVVGKDTVVEESYISKLPYLGAVVKEALRLHPPTPLLVPHCPSAPCVINGYTIPQGCRVFINVWAIHRDPSIWEDPLEFKPERFLGGDNKWDYLGNDFSYLPFGSGRRICVGIGMAERMLGYSLASLLHSFDWRMPVGTDLELLEKFGIVLKKAKPLVAVPTSRLDPELYS